MIARNRNLAALLACLALASPGLAAQATKDNAVKPVSAYIDHKVLANGLEVFVNENHAVPLATIMISFRCGAITQTPQTAGLFHLYEHLMFDGNATYPSEAEFMAALHRMGVANWNGGTSGEYVNYYITVPSDRLAEGLDFWAAAVREPLFEQARLDREKQVVINEIRGYHTDPADIFANALERRAFAAYPWRKDVSGPERNIQNASLEQVRAIRDTYYIPNNAAVLVGGDVDPKRAQALVEKSFGAWKRGKNPPPLPPAHPAIAKGVSLVYGDDSFYQGIGAASFQFRGPDVLSQTRDTYVADVLLYLMSSPVGKFKQAIYDKVEGLYDPEHISFGYQTQRDGGQFEFNTFFLVDPQAPRDTVARVEKLRQVFLDEMAAIAADPAGYFGAGELELAKTKLSDQSLLAMETPLSFLNNITFWWTTATTDYYFNYEKNCRTVSFAEISALIKRWIVGHASVAGTRVLAASLEKDPTLAEQMARYGWERVDPAAAYWWQLQQ